MSEVKKTQTCRPRWWERLFLTNIPDDLSFSVNSKIVFIRVVFLVSVPLLLPLIVQSFIRQSYIHALFNVIFIVTSLIAFFLLFRIENLKTAIYLSLTGIYSLILYIVLFGGSEITDIVFIFVLPYITYFLLECRLGVIVNLLMAVLVISSLLLPFMPVYRLLDNTDMRIRMAITYILINVVSWMAAMAQCRSMNRLEQLAYYDYLTGLPNRKKLDESVDGILTDSARRNVPMVFLMLNIDRLQMLNDHYSHHVGDRILQMFTARVKVLLPAEMVFGRHASADFMIYGPMNDSASVNAMAAGIHEAMKEPFNVDNYQIRVSCCIGVTDFPSHAESRTAVLKSLDLALAQAKKCGPETTAWYNEESQRIYLENFRMGEFLHEAYNRGEVYLAYQPKVRLRDGAVTGMEVLARWKNPEFGQVPPARFIPIAEDIGIIPNLTEWILEQAWEHFRQLRDEGFGHLLMSVNLSPVHIRNANFLDSLEKLVKIKGIDPARIELEITEGLLLQDDQGVLSTLMRMGEMGFSLSLDDFGTGYSSLSYLKKFSVDCIKIDRSFILNLKSDDGSAAIVRAIVAMARSLRLRVTAEGVEYLEQLEFLRGLGCDEAQGFYFSRPVGFDEFREYIKRQKKPV